MKKFFVFFAFCATILILVVSVIGCNKDNDSASTQSEDSEIKPPVSTFRSANKMIQGLYQSDKVHIFDAVVMVAEEDVTDVSIDTTNAHYSLTFKNEVPEIQRGNVVMISADVSPTIVLVFSAEKKGNKIDFYGPLGDLSFVFHDTELVFATNKSDTISGLNVFTPVIDSGDKSKSSVLTSKGLDITETTTDGKKSVFDLNNPVNEELSLVDVGGTINFSINKLKYDNMCEITFTSSVIESLEILNEKYPIGRGDNQPLEGNENFKKAAFECAKEKIYRYTHYVDAEYSVKFSLNMYKAEAGSEKDKKDWSKPIFSADKHVPFPIIGILNFGFDFMFDPDVNLSLDLSYTHSQQIYGPFIQTTQYVRNNNGEYDEIEKEPINKIKCVPLDIPQEVGKTSDNIYGTDIKGGAKFNFPCIFHVSWLDKRALGVGLALIPYMYVYVGGFSGVRNYYGEIKSLYGGYEFGVDWKVGLYRTTLFSGEVKFPLPLGNYTFSLGGNIIKWDLIKFPYKLRTTISTGSTKVKTEISENISIKFEVGKPLNVKFEALTEFLGGNYNGLFAGAWIVISDKSGVAYKPEFSCSREVTWTPKSKDDFLMASVFGENGELVYSSKIEYDNSGEENSEIIPSVEPNDPTISPEEENITISISIGDRRNIPNNTSLTYDYGQNLTFTATVTPSNHSITIYDGGTKKDLKNGFNINSLSVGLHKINVYVDYDPATKKGKKSCIINIEIKEKQEELKAPEITSCSVDGSRVTNGGSVKVKKGETIKINANTNISCEKITGVIDGVSSYVNNSSSFDASYYCNETGSRQYKITATNGNKTATFTFNVVVEDNSPAPHITSVKVNGSSVSEDATKYFDYGEEVQIEVKTDIVCDEISVDFPDYNTKSANGKDAYKTPWFDATESGTVTITATKNGKTAQFVFYIDVEEKPVVVVAPEITSTDITSSSIRVGDGVYIDFETSEKCDVDVYIDGSLKEEFNRTSGDRYKLPTDKAKQYTVKLVAKSLQDPSKTNSVTKRYTVEERIYTIVDAGGLPNNGAQTAAHNYWLCNDLVFQSAEKANFEGSFWVYSNGQDEYNTLYVSKKSGTFSSKEIWLIVSTSITDLRDSNIIDQKKFQGGEKEYSIDIEPTSKKLYLIVYVGGGDCGSMAIDGYYCGPFYYHNAN